MMWQDPDQMHDCLNHRRNLTDEEQAEYVREALAEIDAIRNQAEERCDVCGSALAHLVSSDHNGVLCPQCDQDSLDRDPPPMPDDDPDEDDWDDEDEFHLKTDGIGDEG